MKRSIVAVAMASIVGLSACDGSSDTASSPPAPAADAAAAAAPESEARAELAAAEPAAEGAPAFAALYPGAVAQAEPTLASGPDGPGGLATFTTPADPETVVRFYRERAEASGLTSVTAMDQGATQAYGAASTGGASLQVVASAAEGVTSVQLTWSAGR